MATFNKTSTQKSNWIPLNVEPVFEQDAWDDGEWNDLPFEWEAEEKLEIHEVDLEDYDEWVEKNM